jgi:hypothetical protein
MSGTIKIDHLSFTRFVKIFDRAIGTIEPSNRKIYFYTDGSCLVAYGTDGCLTLELRLGKIAAFDDTYVSPLDDLKLLLSREKKEDVEIKFDSSLQISKGSEMLSILHPFARNPKREDGFVPIHDVEIAQFRKMIDTGSIISREGQMVFLGSKSGKLFSLSEDRGHIGISFMNFEDESFAIEVPYESMRHIVKTLEILKNEKLRIGYDPVFGMEFSDGKIKVCSTEAYDTAQRIDEFIDFGMFDLEIQVKALRDGASLCSTFQRRNGGRGYLELSDSMRFGVISQSSAYEYNYPILWGGKVRVEIMPRKAHQFFSRIGEKYIEVGLKDEYLIFKGVHSIFAVKR